MRACSERAGIVHGVRCLDTDASLEGNFNIAYEPEAASAYCKQKSKDMCDLRKGCKFLVVDAGGGTADLVVHELVDDSALKVKEAAIRTGARCGGTFVDEAFMDYLAEKIGCFKQLGAEDPTIRHLMLKEWQGLKYTFDQDEQWHITVPLPARLAKAWENHDQGTGSWSPDLEYGQIVITRQDMTRMFNGPVNQILELMKAQMAEVPQVQAIFVVGGFAKAPYLITRIRAEFPALAPDRITSPGHPELAVAEGATLIGILGDAWLMSRKSGKTYGVSCYRPLQIGDPPGSHSICEINGEALCKDAFDVFTRIGKDVKYNDCVTRQYYPLNKSHTTIEFTLYSTADPTPKFVTEDGVEKVGSYTYDLPVEAQRMEQEPSVQVSMYFGRTHIQVWAEPINFRGVKTSLCSVPFNRIPVAYDAL
ncbi:unnamed protein product [Calypogeia fissa]